MNSRISVAIFFLVTGLISGAVLHAHVHDNEHHCHPLKRRFSLTAKAGIAPSIITQRSDINGVVFVYEPPIIALAREPQFGSLWHNVPFNLDLDFGYALSGHVELFVEGTYRYAHAKNKPVNVKRINDQLKKFTITVDSFNAGAAYLGFRYFFNRICKERLSFFLGSKFGLIHYAGVNAKSFFLESTDGDVYTNVGQWFNASTNVSGGVQVGFDCAVASDCSLFGTIDLIASSAMKANFNIATPDNPVFPAFTNIIRDSSGVIFTSAITLGLRWYFGCGL